MSTPVNPIPEGYSVLAPYLIIRGAAKALEFYQQALGGTERSRLAMPDGKIGHAEIQFGDSVIMLADEFPEMNCRGPEAFGGSPVTLHLYVRDVDAVVARAEELGAKVTRPVQNQFYGDRSGTVVDPFGHTWNIASRVENLSHEEITRRASHQQGG